MMENNPFFLQEKTYLVTGASSGIGFEICKVIDSLNGKFIAVARREENLKGLLAQCKGKDNKYVVADLAMQDDLDKIVSSFDKIDGIVHAAALAKYQLLKFYKPEVFNEVQAVNVNSIIYILNSVSKKKKLNKNSSVVMIASLGALTGIAAGTYYCATKAELIALSKVWAYELAGFGVRVNCVSPGIVETDLVTSAHQSLSEEDVTIDKSKYPLGYGKPDDIAYPVAFLLSDASKWLTGQNIVLDGGRTSNSNNK